MPTDPQYQSDLDRLKQSKLFQSLPLYGSYSITGGVDKRSQQQLLKDFQAATPAERLHFLGSLEYPSFRDVKQVARDTVAQTIDATGSTLGAYGGGVALGPVGAVAGEVSGSILADRANRAVGLRDPKTVTNPITGATSPNEEIAPGYFVTTGDLYAAAPSVALRGAGGRSQGARWPCPQSHGRPHRPA